ncbi:MAG: hypothetical protein K2L24_01520 [Opitutales bacterium]|nr:hypothetical protein [Opitutales bacterium]
MFTSWILNSVGWLVAHLPLPIISLICSVVGRLFFFTFRRRRKITIENFLGAFPGKTRRECKKLALQSSIRMVELGLLAVAMPFLSEEKIRRAFTIDVSIRQCLEATKNQPTLILLPHFSQMEAMTVLPLLVPELKEREIGVIYRPFKNKSLEAWIRKTRGRFGLQLLARHQGLREARKILKHKGIVVILFDQNACGSGVLCDFLGHLASTTHLPDALYRQFRGPVYMLFPKRTGVFQAHCTVERLALNPEIGDQRYNTDGITTAMNAWLEKKLLSDTATCCDWLWVHNRWNVCNQLNDWLSLPQYPSIVDPSKLRPTKIFLYMPNWLGDVVMLLPLVRAVRYAHPTAEISLVAQPHFAPFLELLREQYGLPVNQVLSLPKRGVIHYKLLWQFRALAPDICLRMYNSLRGDIGALILGARHTFALRFPKKKCPFFCNYVLMTLPNPEHSHQMEDHLYFARRMGYTGICNRTAIKTGIPQRNDIGLICGSANHSPKRWPVEHWVALIQELLPQIDARFVLFGGKQDVLITQAIKERFPNNPRIVDRAGKTDLCMFLDELAHCRLVVGNDTGGVHLANFISIPTLVLFGPTSPEKTRPGYDAPVTILRAPDPEHFESLRPPVVAASVREIFKNY